MQDVKEAQQLHLHPSHWSLQVYLLKREVKHSLMSGITSDCSLLPHSPVLLSGSSADIIIPGAGRNHLSLPLVKWCGPHALLCILTTPP